MSMQRVQCCVVGGGPGGIMVGALLARAGVRVVVLEAHGDFLRDFRGDTVHPSTMDVIAELGWLDDFLKRPHQELSRIRVHIGDGEVGFADFSHVPTRRKFIAFMPQWDFLDLVAERARAFPSFDLWMNAKATELVEEKGRVVGVRGERGGSPSEIRADLVIAADGRHSLLRERAGLRVRDLGAPIDVLWFRLGRREGDPSESLVWISGGSMLALINRGEYWQIAYVLRKGAFDDVQTKGIAAFRETLTETAPFFRDRVGELRSFDDVKLLVVRCDRLERWWRPGMLCIGDAAHAMSPVGGVGINLAIQDAVAAANLLAEPLRLGTLKDADLARVQARRDMPTRATQSLQILVQDRIIGRVLSRRPLQRVGPVLRAVDRWPLLQRIPARIVGVGVRPEHVR
jgi:2-polyprenyl-6-methoxyphenol hydroxylase-like FAD-dependent oxidoreductase